MNYVYSAPEFASAFFLSSQHNSSSSSRITAPRAPHRQHLHRNTCTVTPARNTCTVTPAPATPAPYHLHRATPAP
jgi:hypothetical protein